MHAGSKLGIGQTRWMPPEERMWQASRDGLNLRRALSHDREPGISIRAEASQLLAGAEFGRVSPVSERSLGVISYRLKVDIV